MNVVFDFSSPLTFRNSLRSEHLESSSISAIYPTPPALTSNCMMESLELAKPIKDKYFQISNSATDEINTIGDDLDLDNTNWNAPSNM